MQFKNYDERVAEGMRLATSSDDAAWALAGLSVETVTTEGVSIATWAEDIGVSEQRARDFIRTWDRYSNPNSRMQGVSFNDHAEIARVSDIKAREIMEFAEKHGVSYGIARKRISREANKAERDAEIARKAAEAERARLEALAAQARESDLDAALDDTGNAVAAHESLMDSTRKTIIADRSRGRANEAIKPIMRSQAQAAIEMIKYHVTQASEAIRAANSTNTEIADAHEVLTLLRNAVIDVEFNVATNGMKVGG